MNRDCPQQRRAQQPLRNKNLYRSDLEHDSCGIGFVANISGSAERRIIDLALEALANLKHRGAIDADGKSGDGAGVLTQIPRTLFYAEVERLGVRLDSNQPLAVGTFFLPQGPPELCARIRKQVEELIIQEGLQLFGWRRVPVNSDALGIKAASTAPLIEHALIGAGSHASDRFEHRLYTVRRTIEREWSHLDEFYVASMSSRTIVYKGLMLGTHLDSYYLDLKDSRFETALAVFHQRYSTNTFPNWRLAQPFRIISHNGEINTIAGNRLWMRARESELSASTLDAEDLRKVLPVIQPAGSDSCSFDNVLELMVRGGRDLLESMMMLVPESTSTLQDPALAAFYDYAWSLMEPWDGPAALAFSDGRFVGAALDRNGLRPARYALTADGLIAMSSEAGAIDFPSDAIVSKGRLGPGEMIAVDTDAALLLSNADIKSRNSRQRDFQEWARSTLMSCPVERYLHAAEDTDGPALRTRMRCFGYTKEDVDRVLEPMFSEGKEPAGSMGDDTPLAVLSSRPRPLYHYFRQRFAQVTNPAIDPIRERSVMSLETLLGPRGSLLGERNDDACLAKLHSPILTDEILSWLLANDNGTIPAVRLDTLFDVESAEEGLEAAVDSLCENAELAANGGAAVVILSDRAVDEHRAPIPMLLAVSAVHHHLIRARKRMRLSIIADAGDARDDHQIASLISYGAAAINPYLAFEVVSSEMRSRGMSVAPALRNYQIALEQGVLKIMAKMGIATLASYCGGQLFEAVGLDQALIDKYFEDTASPLSGASLREIARDVLITHRSAFDSDSPALEDAGFYRYRTGGEFHSFNPSVFRALHRAANSGSAKEFHDYSHGVNRRPPTTIRDLLEFRPAEPVPLDEVEPVEQILERFCSSGMSLGALSPEAHKTIAVAMNRIGARSNSGEGGEDPDRFSNDACEDNSNSRIKQVASARFGVTPAYLVSADELEIKISQGSKPGEGGQLPGHKVTAEIAALRHSVPGVTLISPPPHHDIYSIEDLTQLIYDLKQVNPRARVAVKLVSESGVGTVAAGVAKAHAEVIHISGHDGGTGASPLGSIKNAGTPWELGLAETQQVLLLNGLRDRVRLRVDGGLKTGRDVVVAAMLGADEFGFATAAVVAIGCVMARQCHLNTCPVGIATQSPQLRERFSGKPEMVVNFFVSLAEEVRTILAQLGFKSVAEITGRTDLLMERTGLTLSKAASLDLSPVIDPALPRVMTSSRPTSDGSKSCATHAQSKSVSLNERILRDSWHTLASGRRVFLSYRIDNTDRTVPARLAGEIVRAKKRMSEGAVDLKFRGSAGQSFGGFLVDGLRLTLIGEANDYVAKGMGGGEIVIRPPDEAQFEWSENVILGNTAMYGSTGGFLFAAGRAGERFAVRNSGGTAVVEGVGSHGCEYMTAGTVIVLGAVGHNFAAGMTGGVAYVLDLDGNFEEFCNRELVQLEVVSRHKDEHVIRRLLQRHYELTGSKRAQDVVRYWSEYRPLFWKLVTQGASLAQMEASERRAISATEQPKTRIASGA
ncbi:MAG TPA: glutamate synthase large subunit [Blastocatellia bacterium]|nr:glutamate synthase large subunit [Blastocatellia bacterium]